MAARDKTRLIDVPVFWGDSPQKIILFCFSKKQGNRVLYPFQNESRRPKELPLEALTEPDVKVSAHQALSSLWYRVLPVGKQPRLLARVGIPSSRLPPSDLADLIPLYRWRPYTLSNM